MDRRWYDQEPACPRLLAQLKEIPQEEIREFCGRIIIHFCDKIRKDLQSRTKLATGMNSLGSSALSGLYRFGVKERRWYDESPILKKAIGLLYALPKQGLSIISHKLGDTFGLLQIYSTVCSQVDQVPETKYLVQIAGTALKVGKAEAEEMLVEIVGHDLYYSLCSEMN
jgi:hypothetical protein